MAEYDSDSLYRDPWLLYEGAPHCYTIGAPVSGDISGLGDYCDGSGQHFASGWGTSGGRQFSEQSDLTADATTNLWCFVPDDILSVTTERISQACACTGDEDPNNDWPIDPPWTDGVHVVLYDLEDGAQGGGNVLGELFYLHVTERQSDDFWNPQHLEGGLYIGKVPDSEGIGAGVCCWGGPHSHLECKGGARVAGLTCLPVTTLGAGDPLFLFCAPED